MKKIIWGLSLWVLLCPCVGLADPGSFGDMAQAGTVMVGFAAIFANFVCYISGICLWVGALIQYRLHRRNPLQVRLSTPIFYLILGTIVFCIPFLQGWLGG